MFLLYTITTETFHPKVRDFSPALGVKSPNLETNIKCFKKYNSNYSTSKPMWPIMPNTLMYIVTLRIFYSTLIPEFLQFSECPTRLFTTLSPTQMLAALVIK